MAILPFKESLQKLFSRAPVGVDLSSSEWSDVPIGLRERSSFSARVTNAEYLQEVRNRVETILNPRTVERDGRQVTEGMNLATARAELKDILAGLGYRPGEGEVGTIKDLSSDNRLNLTLQTNVQMAQGFGGWLQGQNADALDAFPAQELFRLEDRKEPRNWPTRWMQAGGAIFDGRMIALKDSPVWTAISAFGNPFPPFDFNSGMWVRDVSRGEAESVGLLNPGQKVQPTVEDYNERLRASAREIDPELLASLKESLVDQVTEMDGELVWTGLKPQPMPPPAAP